MLDDYTKATFPLDVKWPAGRMVRLYGTMGGRVFGVSFHSYEVDGEVREEMSQSLDWDGQGIFSDGQHPSMNLLPPPAKTAQRIADLEAEAATAQARLDAMPDAPAEWRGRDERRIAQIAAEIERIRS